MTSLTRVAASLAVLTLAACQQPAQDAPPAAPPASAPAPAPAVAAPSAAINVDTPEQQALAFRAAWDRAPPVTRPAGPDGDGFTFASGKLTPLGGDRYAFISDGNGQDGHVSPGAIAIHYLTRTPDGFRRLAADPLIVDGGTFGNPPQWTVRPGVLPNPALIAESGGVWQGYACSGASVVELAPERPILRTGYVRLHYSNSGAMTDDSKVKEMDGRIVPGTPGRDFKVQYSGASGALVTWRLGADGTYKPVDEPSDLPWC